MGPCGEKVWPYGGKGGSGERRAGPGRGKGKDWKGWREGRVQVEGRGRTGRVGGKGGSW